MAGTKGTGLESAVDVTNFLLFLVGVFCVALYFMTTDERARVFRVILAAFHSVRDAVSLQGLEGDPFFDALRARVPRVIAMPALVVLSTVVFARSPVLDLLISAICLWQIGLIVERLVGPLAFITVYGASGIAAGVINVSVSASGSSAGPSPPVIGIYGFLFVTSILSATRQSEPRLPLHVMAKLAQVAAVFVLYKVSTAGLWNAPALAALVCGVAGGLVAARDIHERTPQVRRLATAMTAIITVVTLWAVLALQQPTRQIADIRPEIDRVIAVEIRTAGLYDKEVERFRKGRTTAAALADVIDKTIVPELHSVAGRVQQLRDVPPEQRSLIASAEAFLKLRDESWRLRAGALHKGDMLRLRQADSKEQASREAFHRLSTARVRNDTETLDRQPPVL